MCRGQALVENSGRPQDCGVSNCCSPTKDLIASGFDFPRGPGAYAPRFCCGPLDFSDKGPEIVCILTRNPVSDNYFHQKTFSGP